MATGINADDQAAFNVLMESVRLGIRTTEEIMTLAYALGQSRGKMVALSDLESAFKAADLTAAR